MIQKLIRKIQDTSAPVCVGLDPVPSHIPGFLAEECMKQFDNPLEAMARAYYQFNTAIIDAVWDLIPAVKPQIAMYEALGIPGLLTYQKTVEYAKSKGLLVIGDVKRGDIGSTSLAYAQGHLGSVEIGGERCKAFDTDMVTVNPYLGSDGVKPFIDVCNGEDKGIFVLVKTSNPSGKEFQDRLIEGRPLYAWVAQKTLEWARLSMEGEYSNVGAVVGATYPRESAALRKQLPGVYFLVPGYGAQGGSAKDLAACFDERGLGAIVNSSRGIIAAYQMEKYAAFGAEGFAKASRQAVKDMIADIAGALAG